MKSIRILGALSFLVVLSACGGSSNGGQNNQSKSSLIRLDITSIGQSSELYITYSIFSSIPGDIAISGECGEHNGKIKAGDNHLKYLVEHDAIYSGCTLNFDASTGEKLSRQLPSFIIDTIPPNLSNVIHPEPISNSPIIELSLEVSEESTLFTEGGCTIPVTLLNKGVNKVSLDALEDNTYKTCKVYAEDSVGNKSLRIELNSFRIDATPPQLDISTLPRGYINNGNSTFSVTVSENVDIHFSGSCSKILKQSIVAGSHELSLSTLPDGTYNECYLIATDKAGNVQKSESTKFHMDNEIPKVFEILPVDKRTENLINNINISVNEPGIFTALGNCIIDSQTEIETGYQLKISVSEFGEVSDKNCQINYTDRAGNILKKINYSAYSVVPKKINIFAWANKSQAAVNTKKTYEDHTLFISRDVGCDIKNINSCNYGTSYPLNGNAIIDTNYSDKDPASGLRQKSIIRIETDKGYLSNETLLGGNFGIETSKVGRTIAFKGKVFYFDGYFRRSRFSTDGVHWEFMPSGYGIRRDMEIVEFNDKLWMFGGQTSDSQNAEIWSSEDGFNWSNVAEITGVGSGRTGHQLTVFQDKLWLIGGFNFDTETSDVWYSENGINWELKSTEAPFGNRSKHTTAVFNNKLYLIAGVSNGQIMKDVWSFDGEKWVEETDDAGFSKRQDPLLSSFNGQWVLIGGYGGSNNNRDLRDLWISDDLIAWRKINNILEVEGTNGQSLFEFDNKLWLTGQDNIRYSLDGINWRIPDEIPSLYPRVSHRVISFQGKMWVIGGERHYRQGYSGLAVADIFSSADGVHWEEVTDSAGFSRRSNHGVVEFNEKLWLIGGVSNGKEKNDVWVSENGKDWRLVLSKGPFIERSDLMLVASDKAIFLMGGYDSDRNRLKDVWKSSNGLDWELITSNAPFEYEFYPGYAYYKGELIIYDGKKLYKTDVENPEEWNVSLLGLGNYHTELFIHEEMLYSYYAGTLSIYNDKDWDLVKQSGRPYLPSQYVEPISHDGYIWPIGGRYGVGSKYNTGIFRYSSATGWDRLMVRSVSFK